MTQTLVVTLFAIGAGATAVLGWSLGYRAPGSYAMFCVQAALVLFTSVRIARRTSANDALVDVAVRAGVAALGIVVLAGLVLGSVRRIDPWSYLVFFSVSAAAIARFPRRASTHAARSAVGGIAMPERVPIMAMVVAVMVFVIGTAAIRSPLTLYDSLSYHLFFPARWLQEHRLSIIPTPFSDEAQAYAPANGELWFLWLMAPFNGDLLARMGQVPFFLLGATALYGLARRLGARRVHAMYAPIFYLLIKRVVEQAAGADVDLVCWSMFLAALYLGLDALERDHRSSWLMWGASLGLYFGSKYISLVYAPVVLILPLLDVWRHPERWTTLWRRVAWAMPGLLLFALPWYARNWIVAGSPIYPSSLTVAGVTIAQGAFTHAAMNHSILHSAELRYLPVMLAIAFGSNLFVLWIPIVLVGIARMMTKRPSAQDLYLLIAPLVMAFLYWFGVPDNLDCRFLLPVTMLAVLPMTRAFGSSPAWNLAGHVTLALGVLWVAVGPHIEPPIEPLPWPIGSWLTFGGMVTGAYVWWFLALLVAALAVARWLVNRPRAMWATLAAATCVGSLTLAMPSRRWCPPDGCQFLDLSSTYIRLPMLIAWGWLTDHLRGATIAYAGNNLPYPLTGERLANRVYYVNLDGHRDWRFHDYDRAHRRDQNRPVPADLLARSSGMLEPLPGPPRWYADAVRPRYERMEGSRDAWIQNLKARGVTHLFVSELSAYEVDFMWHTSAGLPVEDEWARVDPSAFELLYDTPEVRIYAVHLP